MILSMIIGCSFYGYIVASMSSVVSSTDENAARYYEKMDMVSSYLKTRRFPLDLAYRVRQYFST